MHLLSPCTASMMTNSCKIHLDWKILDWSLFWEDIIQRENQITFSLFLKIWCNFIDLIRSLICIEQFQIKKSRVYEREKEEQSSNFSKKSVDPILLHRLFQAFLKINLYPWAFTEPVASICKAWSVQNHVHHQPRFAQNFDYDFLDFGSISMF